MPCSSKKWETLEYRTEKLESSVNKNSQNSSKPPSSDSPFKKPKAKRKKSKRKRGAQKGHKGHQQNLLEPTQEVFILPEDCDCGCSALRPGTIKPYYTHQQIELPEIRMDVLHFILHQGKCRKCGRLLKAAVPKNHQTGYGPRASALIAEMSGIQGSSRKTVQDFCKSVLNFSISTGAIQKVVDRASDALAPVYKKIGELAHKSNINHIDETSWFKNGMLHWLWVMANCSVGYFLIHRNRSKKAFLELIQDWKGILISDNYGTYVKWGESPPSMPCPSDPKSKGIIGKKQPGRPIFWTKHCKRASATLSLGKKIRRTNNSGANFINALSI